MSLLKASSLSSSTIQNITKMLHNYEVLPRKSYWLFTLSREMEMLKLSSQIKLMPSDPFYVFKGLDFSSLTPELRMSSLPKSANKIVYWKKKFFVGLSGK